MAEYIEREAAIQMIARQATLDKELLTSMGLLLAARAVARVTAVDVKPVVRGEWIKIDKYDDESNVQCSSCLTEFAYIDGVAWLCHGYELPLFCPACGADMRGHTDEEN